MRDRRITQQQLRTLLLLALLPLATELLPGRMEQAGSAAWLCPLAAGGGAGFMMARRKRQERIRREERRERRRKRLAEIGYKEEDFEELVRRRRENTADTKNSQK